MKKYFPLLLCLGFLIVVGTAQAETSLPQVVSYSFNGQEENVTFAPTDKVSISLIVDQPVKFSTIAICHKEDSTCSRSTAVKYFTQTSIYETSISKEWDGKTGGSAPTAVPNGEYRIKTTIKDEAGLENIQDLSPYLMIIDSAIPVLDDDPDDNSTTTDKVSTTTENQSSNLVSSNSYVSTHSAQAELSEYETALPKIGAGRPRFASVGVVVDFTVQKDKNIGGKYIWNFGDGETADGEKVSHAYKFPGDYNVVLNAGFSDGQAVSRTTVKVTEPLVTISEVNAKEQYVEIQNQDEQELNLESWILKSDSQKFVFPADTIINAKAKIKIPIATSSLSLASGSEVSLVGPADRNFSTFKTNSLAVAGRESELLEISQKITQIKKILDSNNFAKKPIVDLQVMTASVPTLTSEESILSSTTQFDQRPALAGGVITLDKKPNLIARGLKFVGGLFK